MARTNKFGVGQSESEIYALRLPNGMKADWEAFTTAQGEGAAEALRAVMRHLMKRPRPVLPAAAGGRFGQKFVATQEVDHSSKRRVEVKLTESEHKALTQIADDNECSIQFMIVGLVRAALTHGRTVGVSELKELGKSNYQLSAIGRNLNQITHQINAEPAKHLPQLTAAKIDDLAEEIAQHRRRVQAVVDACSERWVLQARE